MDDRDFWDDWEENHEEEDELSEIDRLIMDELGIEDFEGFRLELDHVNPDDITGTRFSSFMEGIYYLYDAGIIQVFGLVYLPDEDMYAPTRDYPE